MLSRRLLIRIGGMILILIPLSSCRLLSAIRSDGDCDIEQRGANARGMVIEDGVILAYGYIGVWDVRGPENRRSVSWDLTLYDLGGHITSVNLVNTSQRDPALLVIPVPAAGSPHAFILGTLIQEVGAATPALEGLFEPVGASMTAFEIETDLPSRPSLTIPLAVEFLQEDWLRADCN